MQSPARLDIAIGRLPLEIVLAGRLGVQGLDEDIDRLDDGDDAAMNQLVSRGSAERKAGK